MREIKFKCEAPLTGGATIELPKYTQRLKYIKECNFKINGTNVEMNSDQVDSIIKMVEIAKLHVVSVDIKHENGVEAKSFDELEDYPEFDAVIPEIASMVLNGGQMGNS